MDRIQALVEKLPQEVDGALITSTVNRHYFTGLRSSAGVLLVTRKGCSALLDFRYIEVARRTIQSCEVILQEKLEEQLPQLVKKYGVRRLALETTYQTIGEMNRFQKLLPEVELLTGEEVDKTILQLRRVKDEEEIGHIRDAQAITDKSFSEMLNVIKAGMTERQVAAELEYRLKKNGADGLAFATIAVAGPNSSMPHGVPGDRPLQAGDFLTLDFGAASAGYCSDMTRTVAIGHVTEEMEKVYNLVLEAQLASIAKIAPGVPCVEVDAAARDLIYGAGYEGCFGHGTGHSLGLEIHEDPRFSTTAGEAVCQPGIVMSVEPGVYLSGRFGCRIEDIVLITPEGCQDLTHSPKELLIL
ncbi:MAG: aminopeptidase P family protein [Angelakisella sp.]|jgi:Xaa-Pro aminopeptidase|nr:aminopeptidase P family protein [Angelakisella sp.]MCI9667450.1 aminopeptidase P family protein [Angelakisella sp.]